MNNFLEINKLLLLLIPLFLISCGDNDGGVIKLTKGHRDAIKIQCEDSSNKEACNSEVRANFISDGNDYANFGNLTKDQIESVKWNCNRSRKYGLVAYNECLEKFINKAEGGTLFDEQIAKKPKNNIEKLEQSVVYIEMVLTNYTKKQELTFGSGSGVIISNKEIATNCHVAMAEPDAKDLDFAKKDLKWNLKNDKIEELLWIQLLNGKDWAEAKLIKKNEKKDICIIKHNPKELFKVAMKPIKEFSSFDSLKKGNFVRAMGSPGGLIGHTSTGDIQWLGTAEAMSRNFPNILEGFDKDTKFIVHGAKIHSGSSGGPLFDDDGNIIGLNTLISDTAAENIAVSADHIKDLLYSN
jgi:S1-C subfamily serine protease|tara:strand:+ start:3059 stop:4120 length:1062 start_codon:yes stop_codon:yes gene_type:complete